MFGMYFERFSRMSDKDLLCIYNEQLPIAARGAYPILRRIRPTRQTTPVIEKPTTANVARV